MPHGRWEFLCYSYELPWVPDKQGKSTKSKSCIESGIYEMYLRSDGEKGWRLELIGTKHRTNVQVHRAHKSLYIEGCILPVNFQGEFKKGNKKNQDDSVALMRQIRQRYEDLAADSQQQRGKVKGRGRTR